MSNMGSDVQWEMHAWWEDEGPNSPGEDMVSLIRRLLQDQAQRYNNFQRLMAAYEYGPRAMAWDSRDDKNIEDIFMTFNYARGVVDTLVSKTVKSSIYPMPITTGGTFEDIANAEALGQAILGEFAKNKVEEIEEDVYMDGYTLGLGAFYVPHGLGEIRIEFVGAEDIVVDEAECRRRSPRSLFVRCNMDRHVAIERFGKIDKSLYDSAQKRRETLRTVAMVDRPFSQRDRLHNQIEVWMGWHLPSGEDAGDGKFCIAVQGCTLLFADYSRNRFPIATFVPYKRRRHYHGLSLLADILAPQREHDKVTERVQMSNHRIGGTHLIASRKARIDIRELDNGQGTIIEHDDTGADPVREFHPTIVNPQTLQYRQGLVDEMMAVKGVPSMTMTGAADENLKGASGKALELAEEQMAERLVVQQRAKDRCLIDLAWLVIEEAEAIVDGDPDDGGDPNYSVNVKVEDVLRTVRWRDVLIAREEFRLELKPAGDLALTASAKFDQLMQMYNGKMINADQFMRSFFVPDIKAAVDLNESDSNVIEKVLSKMVREGKPYVPLSFFNLQLCVDIGRKFYNLCVLKELPEQRLQLVADWCERAQQELDRQAQAAAANAPRPLAPQGPTPGAPPAPPGR